MEYVIRIDPKNRVLRELPTPARSAAYRELLSVCEAILADGVVQVEEVAYLRSWIKRHPAEYHEWPFADLTERLNAIYADGVVTQEECDELGGILRALVGERIVHTDPRLPGCGTASPTQLIFDDPAPDVVFLD